MKVNSFKAYLKEDSGEVVFAFGRFNPPTVGHVKLATKMKSVSKAHDVKIYTSHTTGDAKNPLTNAQIRKFMNPMLPRGINVSDTKARTITEFEADYNHMMQTLCGDASDNYSGCPSIGPKTAEKILADCETSADLWDATLATFKKKKLSEEVALIQAQVARICRASEYNFETKEVIPWTPK